MASHFDDQPSTLPASIIDSKPSLGTHSLTAARNRLWVVAPSMLTGHQQEPIIIIINEIYIAQVRKSQCN